MKSPEQMGEWPKKPKEEPVRTERKTPEKPEGESEKKITTPEEATQMTEQRRKDFGLGEARGLTPEATKELEGSIKELLATLDQYDFDSFSPEKQDEWYLVEQEARVGKDRELARANLQRFLKTLEEEAKKSGG